MKRKNLFFIFILLIFAIVLLIAHFILPKDYLPEVIIPTVLFTLLLMFFYYEKKTKTLYFYEKVYRTLSQLSHYTELKSLFDYAIHSISELLDAERSTIFLLNPETNLLWTLIAEDLEIKEIVLPVGQGIAGYVAKTGEVVRINTDVYEDPRFSAVIDQKTGFRTKTVLCAPIFDKHKNIIGVIEVLNKHNKKGFTETDEELLELFCAEVGNIILNMQLHDQLQSLLDSVLKSFAAAVDARDPATKGHSLRVMRYALNIAKELRLSENEIKILEYASILHDVGKIGIPDEILRKPEKYTKEEYEIMKTHAAITKEILSKIYFPKEYKDVPVIASMHHEFLDGSGYPDGLKAEQIPLLARILCIADIYDALVSYDRPYKPPFSQQEAIKILYQMAQEGKLDKTILDIFVSKKLYQIEQRKFVRVNKEFAFSYRKLTKEDVKSLLPIIAKTVNISARGLQFVSSEELAVGGFLEIELYLPNFTIECIAKVVYSNRMNESGYRTGIMFINLSKETEQKLDVYLQKELQESQSKENLVT